MFVVPEKVRKLFQGRRMKLLAYGLTKMAVAEKVGIGVASVYRIAKEAREAEESFHS